MCHLAAAESGYILHSERSDIRHWIRLHHGCVAVSVSTGNVSEASVFQQTRFNIVHSCFVGICLILHQRESTTAAGLDALWLKLNKTNLPF